MEHRYNSNKVLGYNKRTPSKGKKRSSKASIRTKDLPQTTKDPYYNERRSKFKKADKRSMSNGVSMTTKDLYFTDQTRSSPNHSNKKDRSAFIRYEDNSMLSSKSKANYIPDANVYFANSGNNGCPRIAKQHNFLKGHVDHKVPSNSFHCNVMPSSMFSPSNSNKGGLNQSAMLEQRKLGNNHAQRSKRMNYFNMHSGKSRDSNHRSNTNKAGDSRSSSVVHPSDLTPLHSNYTKTVKTKNTNEDTLVGSNVYKVSTMENSIKKKYKQSLNLSSNQYNEHPTTADWHSSLPTGDDNIEEIHYFFVMFYQKKNRLIEKLENVEKIAQMSQTKKSKGKNRATSAKRRRKGDSSEKPYHQGVREQPQPEFIKKKNSNVEW
jgi:hypothetical protein